MTTYEVLVQVGPTEGEGDVPFEAFEDIRVREGEAVTIRLVSGSVIVERFKQPPQVGM